MECYLRWKPVDWSSDNRFDCNWRSQEEACHFYANILNVKRLLLFVDINKSLILNFDPIIKIKKNGNNFNKVFNSLILFKSSCILLQLLLRIERLTDRKSLTFGLTFESYIRLCLNIQQKPQKMFP